MLICGQIPKKTCRTRRDTQTDPLYIAFERVIKFPVLSVCPVRGRYTVISIGRDTPLNLFAPTRILIIAFKPREFLVKENLARDPAAKLW
jgi:hypothetical protein